MRTVAVLAASLLVAACAGPQTPQTPSRGGAATAQPGPAAATAAGTPSPRLLEFPVPSGAAPHDVAPARDGGVWFTAQAAGYLGHLDPANRAVEQIALGGGSHPHGVVTGA